MQTEALKLARQNKDSKHPERISWGVVEYQVIDLDRTIAFWTSTLGLQVREQGTHWISLGTQTKTLFMFYSGASVAASASHCGIYHVAIGVPDQIEFSRLMARLIALKVAISPIDHLMSKAIYLRDPNGLEIEIAFETPERFSRFGDFSKGLVLYDVNGQAHSGRSPLDVESELSYAKDQELQAPMSDKSHIAHMHFKVPDLDASASWFESVGFARNLMLPVYGFADMGTGSSYTHRVAMNVWGGRNLPPAPDNMSRLIRYTLHAHDQDAFQNTNGFIPSEFGMTGMDPTGAQVSLVNAV